MNRDFYQKLVDLYAGEELTEELAAELENAAENDPDLGQDMTSLRKTVDLLQADHGIQFTEASRERILLQMQMSGAPIETSSPEPAQWQYHLPIPS